MDQLTLIICTYQRPEPILRLLKSVCAQTQLPQEILIIDGSPDNETSAVIENFSLSNKLNGLRYTHVDPQYRGLTRQRNIGIQQARGDIVAFLDDDTILDKNYFTELLACFARHPGAVGVGGLIINEAQWLPVEQSKPNLSKFRWNNWERRDDLRWRLRKTLRLDSPLSPGWMPPFGHGRPSSYPPDGNDYPVEFIIGASFAWKQVIFTKIQFSNYFEGYGLYEDLDFSIQASKLGEIYVCTRAQLEHHHAPGGRPNQFKYGKMVERNGWYVWRKRWPSPSMINRVKYWLISGLLAALRLFDFRNAGPIEAVGRLVGAISVAFDSPIKK